MRFAAVSTFNAAGLELYGARMMDSFARHWPVSVPLFVYREGWHRDDSARLRFPDLLACSPWLADFKRRHAGRPEAHGRRKGGAYDFRHDAVRFAHKVAAIHHAATTLDADFLVWLDGDIVTHAPVGLEDLERLAPAASQWLAWMDRATMAPETGFLMLNRRHSWHVHAIDTFQAFYAGDDIFQLAEWHDAYVLARLVAALGLNVKSLSGGGVATSHPLVNGPLGKWFDHLKGPRKAEGRSRKSDLRAARSEPYWQDA